MPYPRRAFAAGCRRQFHSWLGSGLGSVLEARSAAGLWIFCNQWRRRAFIGAALHQEETSEESIQMDSATFDSPVTILIGLGFPCKIRTARSALAYLDDRPACDRDEAWEATVATCRDALANRASTDDARNIFVAFARRRDILVEDAMPQITPDLARRTGA